MNSPRFLIFETSHSPGLVALADESTILGQHRLDEARRHARELVPAAKALLETHNVRPRDLTGVIVSIGPGSYTGLRVGIMSAKTLAYATGCALLGVETFAAIARQAGADPVAVIADAQQGKIYVQTFLSSGADELKIVSFADWSPPKCVIGPGLETFADRLPSGILAPRSDWTPRAESLLAVAMEKFRAGGRDDPFALEPLYLRPSSAEELWAKRNPG